MRRLTKAQAELLVAAIDTNDLFSTVEASLRLLIDAEPGTNAVAVFSIAAQRGEWSGEYLESLLERSADALSDLAIDLAELRVIPVHRRFGEKQH